MPNESEMRPDMHVLYSGDILLLKVRKKNDAEKCFVCCDGVVDEKCTAVTTCDVNSIPDIRDCLFRLVYKLSYNAKKDLERKRREGAKDSELKPLQDKLEKEEAQNAEKLTLRKPLFYGESVQLLHVKSGKFLTVMSRQTASVDKQARYVAAAEGTVHSAFAVQPYYKHRFQGEPVLYDEQFILQAWKLGSRWSLHTAMGTRLPAVPGQPEGIGFHEVNCSSEMSGFFPVMYSRDPELLNFATTVRIYHCQTECFLGASCGPKNKRPYLRRLDDPNYESPVNLWSKGMWVLEPSNRLQGGAVLWGKSFCLKHMGSGKYLSVERGQEGTSEHSARLLDSRDDTCFFSLDSIVLSESKVVQMSGNKAKAIIKFEDDIGCLWMAGNSHMLKVKAPHAKTKYNPSLNVFFAESRWIRETVQVECVNQAFEEYVQLLNMVVGRKMYLGTACAQVQSYKRTSSASLEEKSPRDETSLCRSTSGIDEMVIREAERRKATELFTRINRVMADSILFLTNEDDDIVTDALYCSLVSDPERQRIVKDLKYLDATVVLRNSLWKNGYKVEKLTSRTAVNLNLPGQVLVQKPPLTDAELRSLCLIVEHWRASFQDNRVVEDYFDSNGWLPMLNEMNGRGFPAAKALSALVSNNKNLVQEVKPELIETFVDFIGNLGPDEEWPTFMKAVCSCQGGAITSKQMLVLRMMYNPGPNASEEEKAKWGPNRENLLLSVKLGTVSMAFPANVPRTSAMLGKDLLSKGIHDTYVSWVTSKEPWCIGKDWLYFHPEHLGLDVREVGSYPSGAIQHWVNLACIAWVLNPERTYHTVHNFPADAWEKEGDKIKETGRFKALLVLSRYFVAQLDLLAEMCLDRKVSSISFIEKEYTFPLMVCGMYHTALAPTIRSGFSNLLVNLWLDRHPQYAIRMPNVIHKFNPDLIEEDTRPTGLPQFELLDHPNSGQCWEFYLGAGQSREFYTMKEPSKFTLLFYYGKHHLQVMRGRMAHNHEGHNGYTASVMEMMNRLADFGFFYSIDAVHEFLRLMLRCMDGRTDWLTAPMINLEPNMVSVGGSNNSSQQDENGALYSGRDATSEPLLSERRGLLDNNNVGQKNDEDKPLYLQIPDPTDGPVRYIKSAQNERVMECKAGMLDLTNKVSDFALNACVARIVQIFKREYLHAGNLNEGFLPMLNQDVIHEVIEAVQGADQRFDFDALSGATFNTMLCDLLLYESPAVFISTMRQLSAWNHRIKNTITALKKVRLLVDVAELEMYERTNRDVARLANLIYSYRFWGVHDVFGPIDMKTVEECKLLLVRLREICSVGGEGNDNDCAEPLMQDTLANFSLGQKLVHVFDIPITELEGQAKEIFVDIMTLTMQLLAQYVNDNPTNQQEIFRHLDKMNPWFKYGIGVANVVAGVFGGNRALCENLPSSMLSTFAEVLQENRAPGGKGFMPHQLAFVQSVIVVGSRPIAKNKSQALTILKAPQFNKVLHLADTKEVRKKRRELLLNFRSWGELSKPQMLRKWKGGDAEIQYHSRSIELLAMLCLGRDRSGATAYVQSKAPALELATEYLEVDAVQQEATMHGHAPDVVAMCRALKSNLLRLLEYAYYNNELQDDVFVAHGLHARMLESLLNSIERLEPALARGDMGKLDEEFLIRILETLIAYFEFGNREAESEEVKGLVDTKFKTTLQRLHEGKGKTPRKNDVYRAAVSRALGWILNDAQLKRERLVDCTGKKDKLTTLDSMVYNTSLQHFVSLLANDEVIKEAIAFDHDQLIQIFMGITKLTNPTDAEYQKDLKEAESAKTELKPGVDFRRNQLSLDELVKRMVNHCLVPSHLVDWETTEFVLTILNDVLLTVQDDVKELERLQNKFLQNGAVQMVVDTMMAKPDSNVIQQAMRLGSLLLTPNNKKVQDEFVAYFFRIDDSALWYVLLGIYDQVVSNIKYIRMLKTQLRESGGQAQGALTTQEEETLEIFSTDLQTAASAIHLQQVFCEGHYLAMQNYIFHQVDNSHTQNFVEKTVELFLKLCKNEKAANHVDEEEAECAEMALDLLIEVTTGPCPRNQDFLSVSGIVEGTQKVLRGRFSHLRSLQGEVYPKRARQIKSKLMVLINAMLETRKDMEVHRNVLFRTDVTCLMHRLMFVHRWFLSACLGICPEASSSSQEKEWICAIDEVTNDDGIEVPDLAPEALMEDLAEDELADYFNEAFNIVIVIKVLSDINDDFHRAVKPEIKDFLSDPALYINQDSFTKAEKAYNQDLKYAAAAHFFSRWINSIEVVLDGKIFDYYFRMPMLCDFVLGRAKSDIISNCSIESPEDKAKDFCRMCVDTYQQTMHTCDLSKWRLRLLICFKAVRPFNFFLKDNSRNLQALSEYGLGLATVLNACLFNALILPEITAADDDDSAEQDTPSRSLRRHLHKRKGATGDYDDVDYTSTPVMQPQWHFWINAMGMLYTSMMATSLLVVMVTYVPLDYRKLISQTAGKPAAWRNTIVTLGVVALATWVTSMLGEVLPALFIGLLLWLKVGGTWKGTDCPNNTVARVTSTASMAMVLQPVSVRVALVCCALIANSGVYYFYSFLLLDLLFLSPMLQNVIRAVTVPINALAQTTIVGVIVMYEYAIIGFHFFRKDYKHQCQSVLDCTMTTIYQGLRADIGSQIKPVGVDDRHWYARMGFDLSYFVVITTVLMNVIFGIIIDTFGSLRDKTQERDHYLLNNTFISCIDRGEIDKAAGARDISNGFEYLEKIKQSCWSYLNFMFYIKLKDPEEFSGPETRIFGLLREEDVSWMPLKRCMLMEANLQAEEEPELERVAGEAADRLWERVKLNLSDKLGEFEEIIMMLGGGRDQVRRSMSFKNRERSNSCVLREASAFFPTTDASGAGVAVAGASGAPPSVPPVTLADQDPSRSSTTPLLFAGTGIVTNSRGSILAVGTNLPGPVAGGAAALPGAEQGAASLPVQTPGRGEPSVRFNTGSTS